MPELIALELGRPKKEKFTLGGVGNRNRKRLHAFLKEKDNFFASPFRLHHIIASGVAITNIDKGVVMTGVIKNNHEANYEAISSS